MAAANGGGGGHVRSKSDPAQALPGHKPIRPHGFGVLRRSISMDSVDFYFGGIMGSAEAVEEASQFVARTVKARRDHLDAVFDLWMRGHLRSRSEPQLAPAELRHRPIRPHGFFSLLRRSISIDSVEFYFRGFDNADLVINSIHQFVTRTVDARREAIDDDDDDDADAPDDGADAHDDDDADAHDAAAAAHDVVPDAAPAA